MILEVLTALPKSHEVHKEPSLLLGFDGDSGTQGSVSKAARYCDKSTGFRVRKF